jgi:hypothetical protein
MATPAYQTLNISKPLATNRFPALHYPGCKNVSTEKRFFTPGCANISATGITHENLPDKAMMYMYFAEMALRKVTIALKNIDSSRHGYLSKKMPGPTLL